MIRSRKKKPKDLETFKRLLLSHDLKVTPQRIAVHGVMIDKVHASADMVYEALKEDGSCRITLSSVYNILSGLADEGIYARRMSSNNKMYFDINTYRHVHLYDVRNNQLLDVEADELLEQVENGLRRRRFRGYKIEDIDIQILCHPTKKKLI